MGDLGDYRALARAAGLTQAHLARRAGSRPETPDRIESGKATLGVTAIQRITPSCA
jgi:transcriptional regulator with XRE-family HTH domain